MKREREREMSKELKELRILDESSVQVKNYYKVKDSFSSLFFFAQHIQMSASTRHLKCLLSSEDAFDRKWHTFSEEKEKKKRMKRLS